MLLICVFRGKGGRTFPPVTSLKEDLPVFADYTHVLHHRLTRCNQPVGHVGNKEAEVRSLLIPLFLKDMGLCGKQFKIMSL